MFLTEYDPQRLFNRLQQQLNNLYGVMPARLDDEESNIVTSSWMPAVDIKEESDRYVIRADVPGVDPEKIEVTMKNGILTIRGERQTEKKEEDKGYKRVERSYGSFYRRFSLPDNADADNISAGSRNGVLELSIPKREVVKPRMVTVKSR